MLNSVNLFFNNCFGVDFENSLKKLVIGRFDFLKVWTNCQVIF